MPTVPDQLLTTRDVADRLGVTPSTVSRLVARGDLTPVFKLAGPRGAFLFRPADIDQLEQAAKQ
jgi:excisionase family DNA binding protein